MVPADVLSRQALEAQAGDLAIEDALYAVEKALQAGAIAPDVYIKQARPKPVCQSWGQEPCGCSVTVHRKRRFSWCHWHQAFQSFTSLARDVLSDFNCTL